jgi:hypothetical protein
MEAMAGLARGLRNPLCVSAPSSTGAHAERTDMDVETRIADLEREIQRGELRLLVSFAIQSFVEGPFDYDTKSVVPIIDDIVDRWCGLGATERDEYARRRPTFPPVAHFAWDYAVKVEELADDEERRDLPDDFDDAVCVVWRQHAKQLAARHERGGHDCE